MKPDILNNLLASLKTVPGVGNSILQLLEQIIGSKIINVIWHIPFNFIDRSYRPNLEELEIGKLATIEVTVIKHQKNYKKNLPYKIKTKDDKGKLELFFFNINSEYLLQMYPIGKNIVISGIVNKYKNQLQMTHPEYFGNINESNTLVPDFEAVYRLTNGLSQRKIQKIIKYCLNKVPNLEEWQDFSLIQNKSWPSWNHAVKLMHNPKCINDLNPNSKHRARLAYDELLANQISLLLLKNSYKIKSGRPLKLKQNSRKQIIENFLPYKLTDSQNKALSEIIDDMQKPARMIRLIQGDVGSGKTIVAFLTLALYVDNGFQGTIMVPTEILAKQHYNSFIELCNKADIKISLYLGNEEKKIKLSKLDKLIKGEIDVVIGTHSVIQQDVEFRNLGIAIIDEQHRFGVHQRVALRNKGKNSDLIMMTATPIPRSLVLTIYGDMDVSIINSRKVTKNKIKTLAKPLSTQKEVTIALKRALTNGEKIYWVCPTIENVNDIDITSAETRYQDLSSIYGKNKVGLIHGRMNQEEKTETINNFISNKYQILVATIVIEVGINITDATIMIIENAERFGLAQLHQLRGRIGRGNKKSLCILLYKNDISPIAKKRIQIMRKISDGFIIAEEDLKLRGGGELLGSKLSGNDFF